MFGFSSSSPCFTTTLGEQFYAVECLLSLSDNIASEKLKGENATVQCLYWNNRIITLYFDSIEVGLESLCLTLYL